MRLTGHRFLLALPWLLLAGVLVYALRGPVESRGIRFGLYRSSTAEFYFDRGTQLGGAVDYAHDAKESVVFGVPGDIGLVCPQNAREDPRGYRVYVNGLWYLSGGANRPAAGDIALGQTGDLPFCADFDGDGLADSGVFRDGAWRVASKRRGSGPDIQFSFGSPGDRPVVVNVPGAGNGTDRRNVIYGVYRRGMWYLDTSGTGAVNATHAFGGSAQDVPLLIPRWSQVSGSTPAYSLAIFRDGTWYIKPDPDGAQTLSFAFGAVGDIPGFAR